MNDFRVLAAVLSLLTSGWACGQTVALLDFSAGFSGSGATLDYNGSAGEVGSAARLTTGGAFQAGTVWTYAQLPVKNFTVSFTMRLTGSSGFADGLTFALQRVGSGAVGAPGTDLAYTGIGQSVAIKFDCYPNLVDDGTTGIYANGVSPDDDPPESIDLTPSGIDTRSENIFSMVLTYDGVTLHQEITDTATSAVFTRDYEIDISTVIGGDTAHFGFTGATGGETAVMDILTWTHDYVPPPYDVEFSEAPEDLQLLPRDLNTDTGIVTVAGVEKAGGFDEAILRVYRDGIKQGGDRVLALTYATSEADFSFTEAIPAELAQYRLDVFVKDGEGAEYLVERFDEIVAGDVFIIQGQSNADAAVYSGSANGYMSPFIRTYGLNTGSPSGTVAATNWSPASGDGSHEVPTGVGQWGLVLGSLLVAEHDVPVAIMNGADPGQVIGFFQRDDGDPNNTTTNYGRLLYRMQDSGLDQSVRAIFFYQGEQDNGNGPVHEAGYLALREDWLDDYPSTERFYVTQVREGCGTTGYGIDLRNRQRQLGDRFGNVSTMSVNWLNGHDGCHYSFANGYEALGFAYERMVSRDLYGDPPVSDIDPPNAGWAELVAPGYDVVRVHLRNSDDTYTFDPGAEDDFSVAGLPGGVSITGGSIAASGDAIDLQLSGSGLGATSVSYIGRVGSGPWVTNANGVGLLAFAESLAPDSMAPVITLSGADPQTIECGQAYVELGATATDDFDGEIGGWIVIDSSSVTTTAIGGYTVTYNVSDATGNPAVQVTRTVNVVDTTPPVITLIGANPQTIECGASYVEWGATATDACDGDISGSLVIDASDVVTTALGSYTVTYDVTDSSGNPAVQVTRTVNVVDTTPPVITLIGANPQTIECGASYVEWGATATDSCDGDISGSLVIDASDVVTTALGIYTVTYDVSDSSGNPAVEVTRTVNVVDTTPPVITLIGANPQTIECGASYVEWGATATDSCDGDISGSLVIDASDVVTTALGSYTVTYDVTDSSGNPAVEVTRTVNVVDTTPPVITLIGANPQTIECGASYVEWGATATDSCDGDISGSLVIDASEVVTTALGSYTVTYDVTDSSGNPAVEVTRTVNVVDTTPPVITLIGANPQTIEWGASYVEWGATATDACDGDISGSLVIDASDVVTTALGSYTVTYDVSDSSGNPAVEVTRTVNVVDTTPPVITLIGANPQTIEWGASYVEWGATATDACDGDISGSLVIDASDVVTTALGSYTVTYDVTDSSGNPAVQVTRTVNVVDTTPPVITLIGANPQTIECGASYVEWGATATDACDGDISGSLVIDASEVVTTALGSYTVTYDVMDGAGNPAEQVTRTVNVVDTTPPVITLIGANPQTIEWGASYVEWGATATDSCDGDINGALVIDASDVVTTALGSYTVTYDVMDGAGNPAEQVTRTVNVVDTTPPVITLIGANPQTIEWGASYVEWGATATDSCDGDINGALVIDASDVVTTALGSYTVTYDVVDGSGNPAVQVTRTVNVVDTTPPVITLIGANPQTIECGAAYVEWGATATDSCDGDISGSLVIDASDVVTTALGSYTVTYDVSDSSGNPAVQVTRTVDVVDTTPPVITLIGANPQTIECGASYVEWGATATDACDGDISGSLVIDASDVVTTALGSYTVTYDVVDGSGNPASQVTRTVNVVDTTPPVITLIGANPQTIECGASYVEWGATATDSCDGDISGSLVIDASDVVTTALGSYTVTYDVSDSSGNPASQVTRTVNVVDTTPPVITLIGANPQTIECGASYVEWGATATDSCDGDISGALVIDASDVVTTALGSYTVTYDVVDGSGNPAVQVTRTVNVVDTTPPVITLIGANPQTIEWGASYVEWGATATDSCDGDISGALVIDASDVVTTALGSYTVTYDVSDSSGNPAVQVTRTVNVVDTTPPVITLIGANPQTIECGASYVEWGATATDACDGDISGALVIDASEVVTTALGSYTVTYDVSDSSGNPAVQVTRTVDVVDTTPPVITLIGANPQVIECGSSYVEWGATATDSCDGDISGSLVIDASDVVTTALGSYAVTYDVSDSSGNPAVQVTRTVNVVDTTPPVITLIGTNPQTIEWGASYVEWGATATDSCDGDISGSLVIDASDVVTTALGSYTVTYDVTDSSGNPAAQVTRTVDVVDTTPPVITLIGANPQTIEWGASYVEWGATATDSCDGDISGALVIDASDVVTTALGSYTVTYDVSDSSGNPAVEVTRTVNVVDTTPPVITLIGANPQTIECGASYVEWGATATDACDGDISGSLVIDASDVVTTALGSYTVTYDVTDSSGNPAVQVTRTVNVVDTTPPVITLIGSNPFSVEYGPIGYSDPGATAVDSCDGDLSANVIVDSSSVNRLVLGEYAVTYSLSDSSGNSAVQVVRTVKVVDSTPPIIALVGANPQLVECGSGYVELGASAYDNFDGDMSGSMVVDASDVVTTALGSYTVTYDVSDSSGNPAVQVTRTVNVVDTTPPVITLIGANPQTIEWGASYVEWGATATDSCDGDINGALVIDASDVVTTALGSYTVTYDVVDGSGNPAVQVTRTVNVVDTTPPVVTLIGANPQTIECGASYVEWGATATDSCDGDISGSLVIDASDVMTTALGSYTVTYDVMDGAGNPAVQVTRTVNVVDTTPPVITLIGGNPQTVECGASYVEWGATATDSCDGDISGSLVIDASDVVTTALGSYTVTYDVMDGAGNPAEQVTRTVNVVDTTPPVITLIGANPQTIEWGASYVEWGATATDSCDGDISGALVIDASDVVTTAVGSYTVTYDVSDSSGNPAVQVTRTVNVVDTTPPVVTLIGANPQTIECGASYVEWGATATDSCDGDISGSLVIDASDVVTTAVGSYTVTYDVMDGSGNPAAQVTRTVNVVDTTPPVITLIGSNPQATECGASYVEWGATATDSCDGDISGSLVIDASDVVTTALGSYTVTYDVMDGAGNPAEQVTRTVNVVDTTPPVITLIGANPQTIEWGASYVEWGATATDSCDGDISGSLVIDASDVVTTAVGSYTVTYDVMDGAGNPAVQVTRTVNVVDTTPPVITLIGDNPQTIECGASYVEWGATATDSFDGDISGSLVIDASDVVTTAVGSYTVTYDVMDGAGNPASQVTRTVNVVDTTPPVITLIGANPQTIECGASYVEWGATATDSCDGDISGSLVIDASDVVTTAVGSYTVTYDVTDSSGNPAAQVTRTVNVVDDTTPPVITLIGANPQTIEWGASYVELGATATDACDGDISGSLVIDASDVMTTALGSYIATYNVSDSSGNAADEETRTVNVVDTTDPVISLFGDTAILLYVGDVFVDPGFSAVDNRDGNLTSSVNVGGDVVDTSVGGEYTIVYAVADTSGNPTEATRVITVVEVIAPELSVEVTGTPAADVCLSFGSTIGLAYQAQVSSQLAGPWTSLGSSVDGTGSTVEIVAVGGYVGTPRYYRLVVNKSVP